VGKIDVIVPLLIVIMIVGVRLEEVMIHWSVENQGSLLSVWHEYDEGQQVIYVSV
jgi:hypothetical protein